MLYHNKLMFLFKLQYYTHNSLQIPEVFDKIAFVFQDIDSNTQFIVTGDIKLLFQLR